MEKHAADIVLQAQGIKTYFPIRTAFGRLKNQVKAVDDVSLTLYKGETYGLVGETGCGKSTLGRTLMRLVNHCQGKIIFDGRDISGLSEKEMRELRPKIQMVFQDPYTSLNPRKRIGSALTETLDIHGIGTRQERIDMVMSILKRVGLRPEHFYRFPHEFSGGQCQRIGLARALLLRPKLIICDEPVSALDVSIQSQIINLLKDLQEQEEIAYLFIAHDLSVIRHISNRIGVMYLGHLVEEAPTGKLFANPLHPYTQALLSAVPSTNPQGRAKRVRLEGDLPSPINPPAGCVFHTRCPRATAICANGTPAMRDFDGHKTACHLYQGTENPSAGISTAL